MSRRNIVFLVLGVALVLGGAYVSATQSNQRDRDESPFAALFPDETIVVIQDCPYGEASCILGQGIERALQRGFVDAVMEFGEPRLYICPGPADPDAPSPICDGAEADIGRTGYPVARRHEDDAHVVPGAVLGRIRAFVDAIQPDASDEVGPGELTLYAFTCTEDAVPFQNLSCAREGILLSAIVDRGDGPRREVLVFWAQGGFQGRTLPFTELWDGVVLEHEIPVLFDTGGALPDLGDVHVIDQALPR